MANIQATIKSIKYRNSEATWVVASMKDATTQESFIATGDLPLVIDDETLELFGEWVTDKKYGKQFKVTSYFKAIPTTAHGLKRYLASSVHIRGIGEVRANHIVSSGTVDEILQKLTQGDVVGLSNIHQIGPLLAETLVTDWKRDTDVLRLSKSLAEFDIPPHWTNRILRQWTPAIAIRNIERNPYSLAEISGFGFKTIDKVITRSSPPVILERVRAAILYVVNESLEEGSSFIHEYDLIEQAITQLKPKSKDAAKIRKEVTETLSKLTEDKVLISETIGDGISTTKIIYLPDLYECEKKIAERLMGLVHTKVEAPRGLDVEIEAIQRETGIKYTKQQVEAITAAFSNSALVITGGPGTGKTACIAAIYRLSNLLGLSCSLCSPTGRAARRISEVAGTSASTIHRMLGIRDVRAGVGGTTQITDDVLLIDETSMLDTRLTATLLAAVSECKRLIFVGDPKQLPSIGVGTTLNDMLRSNTLPRVSLGTVLRQDRTSLLVRNSEAIDRGELPRFPDKGVEANTYAMWMPSSNDPSKGKDNPEWVKEKLVSLVKHHIPRKFPELDPTKDIQVLTPMKDRSLGSKDLNKVLQEALNPSGEAITIEGRTFRVGDRVMQTFNDYSEGMDVYNGDIGFITEIDRVQKVLSIDICGRILRYPLSKLSGLTLAYAQTIHKAQGSEYPVVIVVLGYQHWPLLTRNILYTANTRATKMCIYVSAKGAIRKAVNTVDTDNRRTFLAQRLREAKKKYA